MSGQQQWINCGTSQEAVKAAIAAFVALGGINYVNAAKVAEEQGKGIAQGISLDNAKAISYSPASFYMTATNWKQLADFTNLKPAFVPVRIKINNEHDALVHENHTVVDGQSIPHEAILRVAAQIKANENR